MTTNGNSRKEPPKGASAAEYELLVDAVRDYALLLLGRDGTILSWNSGADRITGYSAEEAIGSHFSIFYPKEDRESRKPSRELEEAEKEGRIEDEGWRVRKDGTRFWADTIITALGEPGRPVLGFAKVTRDLTERKNAEERLRRNEEMFRLLVASVKDYAIFMLDPDGLVMSWNEGAKRIKGYEAGEVIGDHFSMFYTAEDNEADRSRRLLDIAIREGRIEDEGWRVRKDGSRFWADVVITAIYDADRTLRGFAKVTRDITDQKQAEKMRQELLEQQRARIKADQRRKLAEASKRAAEEANRAKDEFLMMLSHELKTPLTSILGWSRLLQTLDPNDEAVQEGLRSVARSAELQARLVDDILDISRFVAGKLRLELSEVDVAQVVREVAEHIRDDVGRKSIEFETEIPGDLGTAWFDRVRLHQIISNLLNNAVKFTPENGTISLRVSRSDDRVDIIVEDSGEGIDPTFIPHVFEAFKQADMSMSRDYGGLGLGLTIVRHLVEAHGGSISVHSEGSGKGATVLVSLPTDREGEAEEGLPEEEIDSIAGRLDGCQILVVDDDFENRMFFATVLKQADAEVSSVSSVVAALEVCVETTPDLILTDVSMPELSGHDLLRRIRDAGLDRRIPVVAISAIDPVRPVGESEEYDAILKKPIDPFELVAKLQKILAR